METLEEGEIVSVMMRVLWAGAALDMYSDVQDLLDAVTVLRPDNDEARVVVAWRHVRSRAWGAALSELRRVERHGTLSSRGMALAALCLYALRDPAWRTYAYAAAYQSDDPMATHTAQALLSAPDASLR